MTAQLDVFTAVDCSASRHERLIGSLVDLARELAHRAGVSGVTVSDLRITVEQRGLLLPAKPHFLGVVMRRAGLRATDRFRRSDVAGSHGNAHRVWVL